MSIFFWIIVGIPVAFIWTIILLTIIYGLTALFSKEKAPICKNGQCKREIFPPGIKCK